MRTHILIAVAILLSASAAQCAPRSLSSAQSTPVEAPPAQKVQILEAPKVQVLEAPRVQVLEAPKVQVLEAPKVQVLEAPQQVEQPKTAEQAPATETGAARAAPAEQAPVAATPVETKPVEAAPTVAHPVETKPVQAARAPEAQPVRQAQRKQPRRRAGTEHRIHHDMRGIERTIQRHIGFALSAAALYSW
jgi:hypothetical protein